MAVIRSGAVGVHVASPVMEGKNTALVHAPTPAQQTADEAVGDWDHL